MTKTRAEKMIRRVHLPAGWTARLERVAFNVYRIVLTGKCAHGTDAPSDGALDVRH